MGAIPISHTFFVINPDGQKSDLDADIQKLKEDETKNPQNKGADESEIAIDQELEADLQQELQLAAAYRQSDNDPNLSKQIEILTGRDETLKQLVGLDSYIQTLKENPTANEQKIANAEAQQQCIQEYEKAWESYQHSGDAADKKEVNSLIQELQQLRQENPDAPYSSGLIWEDFQTITDQYTILNFNGEKYAVGP